MGTQITWLCRDAMSGQITRTRYQGLITEFRDLKLSQRGPIYRGMYRCRGETQSCRKCQNLPYPTNL